MTEKAIDFFPGPICSPAVDVEGAHLPELRAGGLLAAATSSPAVTSSGTTKARSWRTGGIRDDVVVDDRDPGTRSASCVDVELERAPLSRQLGIAQRDDPALAGARAPARAQGDRPPVGRSARSRARRRALRRRPSRTAKPPWAMPPTMPALLGKPIVRSAGRRAPARRARCPRCRRRRFAARRRAGPSTSDVRRTACSLDSGSCSATPPVAGAPRAEGSTCTPPSSRSRRACPRSGGGCAAASRGGRTSPAASAGVPGTSSSRKRATSSTTSISRVTSRARQVGTATFSPSTPKPRRRRIACCSSGGVSMPTRRRSARAGSERPEAQAARHARRRDRPTSHRQARRSTASQASRPARRDTDRHPSPSGSSPPCAGADVPRCGRSCTARSWRPRARSRVVSSPISVSSPPMIPASATAPLAVGDHQVVRLELAVDAVERAQLLARPRAAHDDLAAGELRVVEGVQRIAEREHDVVRHVDDVGDRSHARGKQPCLQPDRRRSDRRVAEEATDVARAAFEVLDRDVDRLVAAALRVGSRAAARAPGRTARRPRARSRRRRADRGGCGSSRARARCPSAGARPRAACPGSIPFGSTMIPV